MHRPLFSNLTVYISGARQPGEGELKIVDWLQSRIPLTELAAAPVSTATAAPVSSTAATGAMVAGATTAAIAGVSAGSTATTASVGPVGGGRLARRHSLDTVVVCGSDSGTHAQLLPLFTCVPTPPHLTTLHLTSPHLTSSHLISISPRHCHHQRHLPIQPPAHNAPPPPPPPVRRHSPPSHDPLRPPAQHRRAAVGL